MGMDLKLLPEYGVNANFSHDVLSLHRASSLLDVIKRLEEKQSMPILGLGVSTYVGKQKGFEGTCYGKTKLTPYGLTMRYVFADDLREALKNYVTDDWKNQAVILFISQLPAALKIYIYWD